MLEVMAGATGLEPAASGVTGRRSNQLSYAPANGPQWRHLIGCGLIRALPSRSQARAKIPDFRP